MKALLLAWVGTAVTFATAAEAQVWIAVVAGSLTILLTVLKIYDWLEARIRPRKKV